MDCIITGHTNTALKEFVDRYFNLRYKFLINTAHNILSRIHKPQLKEELLTQTYLYVINNIDKLKEKIEDNKLEAIFINYMSKQIRWNKTQFKKENILNENSKLSWYPIETLEDYILPYEEITEEDELEKEKDITDKLSLISLNLSKMSLDQRLLFENYQQGINSGGKLAKYTGLSRTTCCSLLRNLKENLRKKSN